MGGHGGLNILPQKRWNVYNFDNREKVRRDEEAAAREEQLKEEQARQRDAEFRLEKLRQASRAKRGFESHRPSDLPLPIPDGAAEPQTLIEKVNKEEEEDQKSDLDSKHINLFQGWNGFQMEGEEKVGKNDRDSSDKGRGRGKSSREEDDDERAGNKKRKRRKEEEQSVRAVLPEDEVYRLGYGVAGKDVKTPWYLCKSFMDDEEEPRPAGERRSKAKSSPERNGEKSGKKKSLQELREERLKREQKERERTRKLLFTSSGGSRGKADVFIQNRAPYYNSGYGNAK